MNIRASINSYIYHIYMSSIDRDLYEKLRDNSNSNYKEIWQDGENLGEKGWTIPLNSNPIIIKKFKDLNNEELDKEVGKYIAQDYKDGAYNKIINSPTFPDYLKNKFVEANKAAFEYDLLYPATVALTAICEGYLSYTAESNNTSFTSLVGIAESKLSSKISVMEMYLYGSVIGFIKKYFANFSKFNDNNNDTNLNRHWLMHGRTKRDITIYDYFRLFNLLRLLVYFNECANNHETCEGDN